MLGPATPVTVFIDDMYKYPMGQFRRMKMSHMIATNEDELHVMAQRIGIARKWYQGDHYDVCMSRREDALRNGAVPVTLRQVSAMTMMHRKTGVMPNDPVAAEQLWKIFIWSRR